MKASCKSCRAWLDCEDASSHVMCNVAVLYRALILSPLHGEPSTAVTECRTARVTAPHECRQGRKVWADQKVTWCVFQIGGQKAGDKFVLTWGVCGGDGGM